MDRRKKQPKKFFFLSKELKLFLFSLWYGTYLLVVYDNDIYNDNDNDNCNESYNDNHKDNDNYNGN